jgi:glycosyltransferase involved in cell wall biosynthesis
LKNVLWLASWYPNRLDKFDGDFIQRHARAVAIYCKVHVIHIKKDESISPGTVETEYHETGNLTEQVIYYNTARTGLNQLDKYLSQKKYEKQFHTVIGQYIAAKGKPVIVHVHVAMKAGLAAIWTKKKWNIPFVVSEHWTGYLDNADIKIQSFPKVYRRWLKQVLAEASVVTAVSQHLCSAIGHNFPAIQCSVIPNVVDTGVFYPGEVDQGHVTRFIHISNMTYQKNTEAILAALLLLKQDDPFEMYLYGAAGHALVKMIDELGLNDHVFIKGEVPQTELANAIRQSDALVLYSRFETFGCVLIEANACGVPVIVSDLEVFHELIEEGVNGVFVKKDDPAALAEKMRLFINRKISFDKNAMARTAAAGYNFNEVGQRFLELYDKAAAGSGG